MSIDNVLKARLLLNFHNELEREGWDLHCKRPNASTSQYIASPGSPITSLDVWCQRLND